MKLGIFNNKKILLIAQLLGSIFFIYYATRNVNFSQLAGVLQTVDLTYFIIYVLCSFAALFLYVFRWQMVNRIIGIETNFKELYKIFMISYFFSNFLPGSLGGDVYRGYILSKRSNSVSKSLISIFFERGIGIYIMFFIGLCISMFYLQELPIYIFWFFFGFIFVVTTTFLLFFVFRYRLISWLKKFKTLSSFHSFFDAIIDFIDLAKKFKKNTIIVILTSVICQLIMTGITIFLYYSLGTHPDFIKMIFICFLIFILVNVPISINGLGLREVLFIHYGYLIEITAEQNTIVSIMIYITSLLMAIVGLVIYIFKKYSAYINKSNLK